MEVIISGRSDIALIKCDQQWLTFEYGGEGEPEPVTLETAREVRQSMGDCVTLEAASFSEASGLLEDLVDQTEALDCLFFLLDSRLEPSTRKEAALELAELIVYPEIASFLYDILLSAPLPFEADPGHAIEIARAAEAEDPRIGDIVTFLTTLQSLQPSVAFVSQAWADFDISAFNDPMQKQNLKKAMAQAGIFSALVKDTLPEVFAGHEKLATVIAENSFNGLAEQFLAYLATCKQS